EFMVLPGESVAEMQTPERAWELLQPWGLTPGNAELERAAVYRFQARWAKQWHKGRCLIGGDAAHLMPPFAGEGLCAGLRDAVAMAWRLNLILEDKAGLGLLDSYTSERKDHACHYIDFSQELGSIICIADETEAAARDARMIAELQARGQRPVPTDICHLGPGAWCPASAHAGELSVQGVVEHRGRRDRFDQAVGRGWVVIGYEADPLAALMPGQRAQLDRLEGFGVQVCAPGGGCAVIDAEGTYKRWLDEIDAKYVLIRPDFYVAATANSPEAFQQRVDAVMRALDLADSPALAAE
ncbi:FAD-dependent monooxygenase, partial [Paracoccus sp. PXZ]